MCACRVASDYVALVRSRVHVAVGYYVCAVELNGWSLAWSVRLRSGACLGLHYVRQHDCIFAIGDMEVTRISMNGTICWSKVVAEAMTRTFDCLGDSVIVTDFDGVSHRLNVNTGARMATDHGE